MIIGLTNPTTIVESDYVSVPIEYWRIKEINLDATEQTGYISIAPYKNKAYLISNGPKSYYKNGIVTFNLDPENWPFVIGTDPVQKAYGFVKLQVGWESAVNDIV